MWYEHEKHEHLEQECHALWTHLEVCAGQEGNYSSIKKCQKDPSFVFNINPI